MEDRGETVLVTGCSSGFGDLIARTLGAAGYRVFGAMRDIDGRNREAAERLRAWAQETGVEVTPIEMDVADEQSVRAGVDAALAETGGIDVVVNNAGIAAGGPIEAFSVERAQAVFDTNLFGPFRVNQAVLPQMRARGSGLLIHVTSTLGRVLPRGGGIYPTTKFALEALAESLSYELAPFGVDVAILEPGRFPTPAVGRGLRADREEIAAEYRAATPPRQDRNELADPQEVADAVLQLIETPSKARPLRTVVGAVFTEGVADYNLVYEEARDRLAAWLGRLDAAAP